MCQFPAPTSAAPFDTSLVRVVAVVEPGSDLLDRAQAGWEHFLSTFEGAPDE